MNSELYTPGHTENASDFMAKRSLRSHGAFFLSHLEGQPTVLDCGCGPGTITLGIAAKVAPAAVVGVDVGACQIDRATAQASRLGAWNVSFRVADCYALPFEASTFDRVFSHALLEHVGDPGRAVREMGRVLKPGGVIGLCSPDWDGFLLSPPSERLSRAVDAYRGLQSTNGGDVTVGRKLGVHLEAAGFEDIRMTARYECYPSLELISDYLAIQLEANGDSASARVFRDWSREEAGMFAQAWVSAVATKPAGPTESGSRQA